ncbi:MAG: peptidoglycan DD-metalloendopeptidase family protein [Candidatus Buchananbacteria bacterium]|nr:peptidoglycan DD-metalloendopeptidase family protein [Candidatus Buchananbacteria bacterium]
MLKKAKFLKLGKYHVMALILMPIILFGAFLFTVNSLIAQETPVAPGANEGNISDLNKQIDEQRKKIDEIADKITEYNNNISKFRSQAGSLKNQVAILDNQIAKTELDIEGKVEEVKATELEISKVELEIVDNQKSIEDQKKYLSAFIRLLDFYDDKDYLSVLLDNNSFSEFFDQINNIEGIEEDLQKTLNRFQEMVERYNAKKEELSSKRDQLSELLNKLESERDSLANQIGTKQYLIAETSNSEKKYQTLIGNLKQEQLAANNAVAAMENKLRQELEKKGTDEEFNNLAEASLMWPTNSRRKTAYFHDPDYPYRNLFEHSGLDIGVSSGTTVRSAEAGYVAKVAIGTKWYGNYIMIIHNNNLATLYAHLSSVSVKNDQYVTKGQIIGASGSTGFSSGPHLHFEVRSGGIPVDPLNYLP